MLRANAELKYKDGDAPWIEFESNNVNELLVFTNLGQCYKCKVAAFEDTKSAQLGGFLPTELQMEPGEVVTWVLDPGDYGASVLFCFENGRASRVALSGYATKQNRKKLKNAIYTGSPLLQAYILTEERDVAFATSDNRVLCFNTELLRIKTTNNTQGVQAMTVKGTRHVLAVGQVEEFIGANVDANRFRAASLPSPGAPIREQDQKSLFD